MKFYLAYSIHGTNCFITAKKEVNHIKLDVPGKESVEIKIGKFSFTTIKSRRPGYKLEDGIKLHSSRLLTKNGQPLKSPAMVVKFFNELAADGWEVDKAFFVHNHWTK